MCSVMELQVAVQCALFAVVKVSDGYVYIVLGLGQQLAGVWVTRGLKCRLIESAQWHRDELTQHTFLFSLLETSVSYAAKDFLL